MEGVTITQARRTRIWQQGQSEIEGNFRTHALNEPSTISRGQLNQKIMQGGCSIQYRISLSRFDPVPALFLSCVHGKISFVHQLVLIIDSGVGNACDAYAYRDLPALYAAERVL